MATTIINTPVIAQDVLEPLDETAHRSVSLFEVGRLAFESLLANTDRPEFEVLVVDNGSADDTPTYLRKLAAAQPKIRPIFNQINRGFAPAVNQGLTASSGDAP